MTRPNLATLEIDITYVCGMQCHNCNRMTQLLPGHPSENVTPEQIDRLIEDSLRLAYPWRHWWLVGGEPTTHPELEAIIRRISRYRDRRGPDVFQVGLATHGHGTATQLRLRELRREFPFLRILNSRKRGRVHPQFVAPCMAPIDRAPEALADHVYTGCSVSWNCGVSMNRRGFYCCAVAGAMDRICGGQDAIRSLEELTEEAVCAQWQRWCPLCGYYAGCGLQPITGATETLISPTWQRLLAIAQSSRPRFS